MNNDLISRKYLKEQISELWSHDDAIDIWVKKFDVEDLIDNAPTVEPEKAKESEIVKAYTKGFDTGVETVKNKRPQGDRKERTCPYCQTELLLPTYMYKGFHCPYCGEDIADMQKGGAE